MKRKFQKLSTKDLQELLNEHFQTNHLSNDILDLVPERKRRRFIIEKFLREFSTEELTNIIADYF